MNVHYVQVDRYAASTSQRYLIKRGYNGQKDITKCISYNNKRTKIGGKKILSLKFTPLNPPS